MPDLIAERPPAPVISVTSKCGPRGLTATGAVRAGDEMERIGSRPRNAISRE